MLYFVLIGFSLLLLSGYLILCVYFIRGFRLIQTDASTEKPKITVIVPAHNEEKTLPVLLKCLSKQSYPKGQIQIILVDDRSTDDTPKVMKRFAMERRHVKILRIVKSSNVPSPKKNAILQAIRHSRGRIIITTDADCRPNPDWIKAIIGTYDQRTGTVIGYAPYRTDGPYRSFFHKLLALEYFSLAAVALSSANMGIPTTCNGANFSYRRKAFKAVGGFGENQKYLSGDDDLLLQRIHAKTTLKVRYAVHPDASVFNNPPAGLSEFFWQRIRFSSKHLAYPKNMLFVLLGIYLFNLILLVWLLGSFFSLKVFAGFCILLTAKSVIDCIFLYRAQCVLEKRNLLKYYPFAMIPHILYVVLFPLLGQIFNAKWK